MIRPIAILAFSHDPAKVLGKVKKELASLEILLEATDFSPKPNWQITQDKLEKLILKFKGEVGIFHFAGHAGSKVLQLNIDPNAAQISFAEGISDYFGSFCPNLKLVFLNGCSTEEQIDFFHKNGASAVIATTLPVDDEVAAYFAEKFYSHFLARELKLSLRSAFENALTSIKTRKGSFKLYNEDGSINTNLLQKNKKIRGSLLIGKSYPVDTDLYVLKPHPDKSNVEQETFQQWEEEFLNGGEKGGVFNTNSAKVLLVDDATNARPMGVDRSAYLLCDRNRPGQFPLLKSVIQDKIEGNNPVPNFIFIHDQDMHCPEDLVERLRDYGMPKPNTGHSSFLTIDLPYPEELFPGQPNDPANLQQDYFKIKLSEVYQKQFGGTLATSNQLCRLNRRPAGESLIVVHHRFEPDYWCYFPREAEAFLRYYINDFGNYLQSGFSERIVVVFSVIYYHNDDYYPYLFRRLHQDFAPDRIKNLSRLTDIVPPDVDSWQREILRPNFFRIPEIFKDEAGNSIKSLSFYDTKNKLIPQIERYNRELAAYGTN